jgi:hypothetical protein
MTASRSGRVPGLLLGIFVVWRVAQAEEANTPSDQVSVGAPSKILAAALPPGQWKQVEDSVDRGLAWLASRQDADGSFPTLPSGQPAVTSFSILAFLSRGHQPGLGPYGQQLNRAIDFVVSCQKPDGLFSYETPEDHYISRHASHTAAYNHAIAGLMLGEVYGHVTGQRAREVKKAIEKALQFTRNLQIRPKEHPLDIGGWRYLQFKGGGEPDSDLSVTAWQLMFLRSARNAEFAVPQAYVNEAVGFVRRCWDPTQGVFTYGRSGDGGYYEFSRGMMGAGILSLSMAGHHQTAMARAAGDWLLAHPYKKFGEPIGGNDRFFYSAYHCSQAALQLGGRYWEGIFPPLVKAMLSAQSPQGSWPAEPNHGDAMYGNAYTTAMAVLSLTPAYQLLPVYQK